MNLLKFVLNFTSEKVIKNKRIPKVPSWLKTLTTELNKSLNGITVALYYGMTHSARGNVGACGQTNEHRHHPNSPH